MTNYVLILFMFQLLCNWFYYYVELSFTYMYVIAIQVKSKQKSALSVIWEFFCSPIRGVGFPRSFADIACFKAS